MTQFLNVQPGCEAPDFIAANSFYGHQSTTRTEPMLTMQEPRSRLRSELPWGIFTALVCAHFSLIYNFSNRPFLNLQRYAAGKERSPFQERVLMAWLFHAFGTWPSMGRLAAHLPGQLQNPYLFIQLIVSFMAICGAVAFTRGSIASLTGDTAYSRWAALLIVWMTYFNLALIYGPSFTLPYDVPSLFFFAGCVYSILRRRYWLFYPLFVLGTLNRETICFVTVFFVVWEWTRPASLSGKKSMLWMHASLQAILWIAIKLYLKQHFQMNAHESSGAGLYIPHLRYNLLEILKPQQWPLLLSNFGFTLPLLISQRRWIRDKGIALACAIILPLWLALMFYVGVIIEIRIFSELSAIVSIAIALIAYHRWFDRDAERRDEMEQQV